MLDQQGPGAPGAAAEQTYPNAPRTLKRSGVLSTCSGCRSVGFCCFMDWFPSPQALYELLRCDHNIQEAVERYCRSGKASQGESTRRGRAASGENAPRVRTHGSSGSLRPPSSGLCAQTRTVFPQCLGFVPLNQMPNFDFRAWSSREQVACPIAFTK